MNKTTTIKVSVETRQQLNILKAKYNYKSIDDLLFAMANEYNQEVKS